MRLRSLLVLPLAVVALGAVLLAGPAAPAGAYPATICATLEVSTTNPLVGATITVSGSNFDPNATIKLVLHSQTYQLGSTKSDSLGSFTKDVKLPTGVTGHHLIEAIGGTSDEPSGCPADPIQALDIQSNGGSGVPAGNGGTAFTGLDILALIAAAVVLLGGGVLINRGGKRRRAHQRV